MSYMNPTPKTKALPQRPPRKRRVKKVSKFVQSPPMAPQLARQQAGFATKIVPARAKPTRNVSYLNTLVDPENVRGVKYPDEFAKDSASVRNVINRDPYVFKDDVMEPAGYFFSVLSPTMIDPLLEYQVQENQSTAFNLFGGVSRCDDEVGLFPLSEDSPSPATASDQMWATYNTTYNLKTQWHWEDQNFTYPGFRGVSDAAGSVFYGVPCNLSTVPGTLGVISIRVTYGGPVPATACVVQAVNALGTINFTPDAVVAGSTTQRWQADASVLVALGNKPNGTGANLAMYFGLPGLGFRYTNNTTATQLITAFTISIDPAIGVIGGGLPQARLQGIPIDSQDTFCKTVDQYRVVSMSLWNQFTGSSLKDGGQLAATLYRGGQSPMEVGMYTYDTIAMAPEGMSGKLKEGSYSIWVPNCTEDMEFRVLNSADRWKLPYIVTAGKVSEPDQDAPLRFRIPINYELISTDQIYSVTKPMPDPRAILIAGRILRAYPTTVPNELHFGWIRDILKKAVSAGKNAAQWTYDNRDWIIPAATAASALL